MSEEHGVPLKSQPVKIEFHLEPRPGDKSVNSTELNQFSLFRRMRKSVSVERFPGSILLRHYRKGEVVFQQGQAGGTAFYIPTAEDLAGLRALQGGQGSSTTTLGNEPKRQILSAMILPASVKTKPRGFFDGWFTRETKKQPSRAIPCDSPSDIDYVSRVAPLMEGDLFGEMSCISYMPRSATVIACVDCELLEFNRNVFDQLSGDPNHQASVDAEYRRRTLDTHLRQFDFFHGLTDSQIEFLKENASLETIPPGNVICEEGETWSDSKPLDVFIVRNGVVQVTVNANLSAHLDDIRDWSALCRQLAESRPAAPVTKSNEKPGVLAADVPLVSPSGKKPSPQEMMAAMRARKLAATTEPAAESVPSVQSDTPVESAVSPEPTAPKKPSPQEILAAMRARKLAATTEPAAESVSPVQSDAPVEPAVSPEPTAPKKPSPQEMLAGMRAKQQAAPSLEGQVAQKSPTVSKLSANRPAEFSLTVKSDSDDSKEPLLLRESRSKDLGSPAYIVYSWFSDFVQSLVSRCAQGESLADTEKQVVLNALNSLAGSRKFLQEEGLVSYLEDPEIQQKVASFPKGLKGIDKAWSEVELRTIGRAVLSEVFPDDIRRPIESSGPPRVLAYHSRGACIGEIAVVNRSSRNATCVAYNHPSSENARNFGHVELVRIPGTAFRKLMDESTELRSRVEDLAAQRLSQQKSFATRHSEPDLVGSTEFQQMGLFQGTKLLVIDLDSCTRCGDCVEACVSTHDDGYSRLFLDGPRYDRFLVPSACRNCLNPVCMIGCPVGSIGRGDNGQIEIFDWCIGCSTCAEQCPYDSIQMHDLGLIPEESLGWVYADRRSLPDDWYSVGRLSAGWRQGKSPFQWQGDFLRFWTTELRDNPSEQPPKLCFRHEFRLPKQSNSRFFRLSINDDRRKSSIEKNRIKKCKISGVWLNGRQLNWSGSSIDLPTEQFVKTNNLIAIEVIMDSPTEYGQFILSASLDAVPEAGDHVREVLGPQVRPEMELMTRRAAVCDLCSHISSQQPACVSSCPHDAAIRINPLVNFPV